MSDGPAFDGLLPPDPADITAAFFEDYRRWNDFGDESYAAGDGFGPARQSYDRLIRHYCGADKVPQNIAFGSEAAFSPERSRIAGTPTDDGGMTIVAVENSEPLGGVQRFQFHYAQRDGRWLLDEVYYLDERDGDRPLRYL